MTIADIGCGTGTYHRGLRTAGAHIIGIDRSAGMLADAPEGLARLVVGDAEDVPLRDASVDRILMAHMLYHVPDIDGALGEGRRVLRADGAAVIVTNSADHLREMDALWNEALHEGGLQAFADDLGVVIARFRPPEAREYLSRHFRSVEALHLRGHVVVTDSAPVLAHAASTTQGRERAERALTHLELLVAEHIRKHGEFRITTDVVAFRCS